MALGRIHHRNSHSGEDEESASCYTIRGVFQRADTFLSKLVELRTEQAKAMVLATSLEARYADIAHSTRGFLTVSHVFDTFTATIGHSTEYRLANPKPHLEITQDTAWISENLTSALDDDWLGRVAVGNAELAGLADVDSDRIIHIQCPSGAEIVAGQVRNYIDSTRPRDQMLLYFPFKPHDVRFNSIQIMLKSFVAQIRFNRVQSLNKQITAFLDGINARQALTTEDLFQIWQVFRLNSNIAISINLLGSLDECDDSALWFLSHVRTHTSRSESNLKFVTVTTRGTVGEKSIVDRLSSFPSDCVVRINYALPSPVPIQVGLEASIVFQENAHFTDSGLQEDVVAFMSGFQDDKHMCRLLIEWLKSREDVEASVSQLFSVSKTPVKEAIFDALFQNVPQEHREWALKLLSWVLSSVRPLRAFEFGHNLSACASQHETRSRRYIADALRPFRGILTLSNDEMEFSHPPLRGWLQSDLGGDETKTAWYRQNNEHGRQSDILQTCLPYLRGKSENAGASISGPALQLPYATRFLTHHLREAGPVDSVLETVFEHEQTLQRWIHEYMALLTPFAKPFESSLTAFPIAAHFDLDGIALVEAARGARMTTLHVMIEAFKASMGFDNPFLQQVTQKASRCGYREVYREMVNHIPEPLHPKPQRRPKELTQEDTAYEVSVVQEDEAAAESLEVEDGDVSNKETLKDTKPHDPFFWLTKTLPYAAWLGMEDTVAKLVHLGADPDPPTDSPLDISSPLETASSRENLSVAKVLVAAGANVNAVNKGGNGTAMHIAVTCGNHELVKFLVDSGASLDLKNCDGLVPLQMARVWSHFKTAEALMQHRDAREYLPVEDYPLMLAIKRGNYKTLEVLLRHGLDPNFADEEGHTALWQSIYNDKLNASQLLLKFKANPDLLTGKSTPPLLQAVIRENLDTATDITDYLLSQNADITLRDQDDWAPMWTAAHYGLNDILRRLLNADEDVDLTCTTDSYSPLHMSWDHPETVRLLPERGADVNKLSAQPSTPLGCAMEQNRPDTLRLMLETSKHELNLTNPPAEVVAVALEASMDVNRVESNNWSLISLALPGTSEATVRTILEYDPDLDIKDTDENTPLHQPLAVCNMDVVKYLLTKKAGIATLNLASFEVATSPLHIICEKSTVEVVQLLINKGSNIDYACTNMSHTPLMMATLRNRTISDDEGGEREKIIKLLLGRGAGPNRSVGPLGYPIISASFACTTEIVQWLLDRNVSTSVRDPLGKKTTHLACYNSLEMLEFLNVPDSDFAVQDLVGRVPLHYAVHIGQPDLVNAVLERFQRVGVDINVRDNDGWTPLLWAARASSEYTWGEKGASNHEEIVSLLLEKGASTNISGQGLYKDWTALEVAQYHNADSIADLLVTHNPAHRSSSQPKKRGEKILHYYCDCCLLEMSGVCFKCAQCLDYALCFKCYRSSATVHPQHEEQSELARSMDVGVAAVEEQIQEGQFDDEIVGDDDMSTIAD
ncbi:ankyrin repeat-containing domain protein [Thelonectria olida]|uniref:Ankyrin repeat-containing domain protein n=1 Tax=Thelonectria olida TaxID=1576542 RepID=A0A9P8W1K3_9HYPO|nr:ankyrin repeat-containing domain protein [Thelonectria olida]